MPEGYRRSIRAAAAEPAWLILSGELQAMAQTGIYYSTDKFDTQRYQRLRVLASEMMAMGSGAAAPRITELFSQDIGYATPRVAVRGGAFRDGKILLVREVSDSRWAMPGGWADVNQTASECVVREIWEESGFTARVVKLVAIWDRRRHRPPPLPMSVYNLYFLCELTGGVPQPSIETSEIGFFTEDELPDLSPGRTHADQIRRMFAHHREPGLPTEFD